MSAKSTTSPSSSGRPDVRAGSACGSSPGRSRWSALHRVTLGPVEISFDVPPDDVAHTRTPIGNETHVSWNATEVVARIRIT